MEYSKNHQNKKAVLFDLDHTLWDHERAQKSAVELLCRKYQIDFDVFYRLYPLFNREAWNAFARKSVTLDELRILRFAKTLEASRITHLSPSRRILMKGREA